MFKTSVINKYLKNDGNLAETLVLRQPKEADAKSFVAFLDNLIVEDAFLLTEHQTLKDEASYIRFLRNENRTRKGLHVVIMVGNKKVAGADMTNLGNKREHAVELQLYISSKYRGIGLGRFLIRLLENEIRKINSIKLITLEVFSNNLTAINLYNSFGFVESGRVAMSVKSKGKLVDMVIMTKKLS